MEKTKQNENKTDCMQNTNQNEAGSNYYAFKKRIFDIIQIGNTSDLPSRLFDYFLVAIIFLNILVLFLQTFKEFDKYANVLHAIELITAAFFCIEYALRIWTSDLLYPDLPKSKAVIKFLTSFDGIVDFCTILPFFWFSGFVAFRMLRVVRIFHLFRINAYYDSFSVIKAVLYEKRNQLISSLFIIIVLMLAASLFMYSAEHDAQPEVFANGFSGIWWSMSTLLTVGYGDIYPITMAGRAMAIIIAFLGVGAVAIPTGIISAGFVEQYSRVMQDTPKPDTYLQTVTIDIDSKWIGKTVGELDKEGYSIVMVKKGDAVLPKDQNYRIAMKDELSVYVKE